MSAFRIDETMSQPTAPAGSTTPQPLNAALAGLILYLLDTNILLRLSEKSSAHHQAAKDAIANLLASGAMLFITAQNLIEFLDAATRPIKRNGLGMTRADAKKELETHKAAFLFLPDIAAIYPEWERLVDTYQVEGKHVHDTRLAAVALIYRVPNFLTFNGRDFQLFAPEGLTIIDPATVQLPPPIAGKKAKPSS
jgi:predicted nucleic acid-binding protein